MHPRNPHFPKRNMWPEGVVFTDANDHNPTVKEECAACGGLGEREELVTVDTPEGARQSIEWVKCPVCGGSGLGERLVKLFDESPTIAVEVGADGWLTCPRCNWSFTIRDPSVWTGRRHKKCGQRIDLVVKP